MRQGLLEMVWWILGCGRKKKRFNRGEKMKWVPVILSGFFLFGCSDAWGANWKLFSKSETGSSFFYDAESVSCQPENIVRVWVKLVVSEEERLDWVAKGGKKYTNLTYIKSSLEINCEDKSLRSLSLGLFSEQDILDSFNGGESKWGLIPPGSNWDNLYKAMCK
jgi:hypothetical protein